MKHIMKKEKKMLDINCRNTKHYLGVVLNEKNILQLICANMAVVVY